MAHNARPTTHRSHGCRVPGRAALRQNERWKGLTWGMMPLVGSGLVACSYHFFYNGQPPAQKRGAGAGLSFFPFSVLCASCLCPWMMTPPTVRRLPGIDISPPSAAKEGVKVPVKQQRHMGKGFKAFFSNKILANCRVGEWQGYAF